MKSNIAKHLGLQDHVMMQVKLFASVWTLLVWCNPNLILHRTTGSYWMMGVVYLQVCVTTVCLKRPKSKCWKTKPQNLIQYGSYEWPMQAHIWLLAHRRVCPQSAAINLIVLATWETFIKHDTLVPVFCFPCETDRLSFYDFFAGGNRNHEESFVAREMQGLSGFKNFLIYDLSTYSVTDVRNTLYGPH